MANLLANLKSQLSHLRHKKDKDKEDKDFDEITDSLNSDASSDEDQNPDMQDEMPDDTGEIDYSDDESDKEKAKGVKKNTVMLGVGAVGVCLVAAVVASALTPPTKQQDPPINSAQLANTKTQNNKDPAKGIPDKYSDISKYSTNGSKANDANGQKKTQDNIKPKTSANASGNANGNTSSVYAANYTGNRNNGSSNSSNSGGSSYSGGYDGASYAAPAVSYQPSAEEKRAQDEADRVQEAEDKAMQSAISFAVKVGQGASGGGSAASGSGAVAMSAGSTGNQVVSTSYSLTDGSPEEVLSYALQAGSVIQATLITGITTDVDGSNVVAQVRQNIYDTQTGEHLLIPQGSRIIGQAKAAGGRGNARVEVAFTRLIYPDGHDIALPKEKAIDGVGYNGLRDKYTEHSGKLYGTAFVTALLSAAAQSATGNTSGTDDRSPGQEAVSGAVADVLDSMKSVIDRQSNVKPTATIRPGTEFSVFITQDLFLAEYEE